MTPSKNLTLLLLAAGALALSTSCTTIARGTGALTANPHAKPQSGTVWIVPPPQLEPPAQADRTVYISYRNLSDADIDLDEILRSTAQDQGWDVVYDPREAKYRLRAQSRFFGEVEPDSGGRSQGEALGWIGGAAVGAATWSLVGDATGNGVVGAIAGGAAGSLAGLGVASASSTREWALITDFVLEEYSEQELEFEVLSSSTQASTTHAGVSGPRSGDAGVTGSTSSTTASMTRKGNYYPHGVRLSTWANQMGMTEEEAAPLVLERTRKVVRQLLPM